ncbi:aminotransferase class V-fold PLP-dependent enzyme [Cellulomonas sp. DKR-3]|uniref:Aminotransferase class V-fold PLP-dependent enzyme n=1 Tax=Cellulomonas fulva TaxID=2835530 RepID=A0ABS5TWC1_9CELL|nr:aminotransferase class V-fold PLP-dependent enzyme [Cellulomonas fulva]MBT0993453.1 aminotransferase class V-fold PLP-dependent enzyme [Cellulomonas fulva]
MDLTDESAVDLAVARAKDWLSRVAERPIAPAADVATVQEALGATLPPDPQAAVDVVGRLVAAVEPALIGSQSPRFYGWVIGGTHPVALAADWLVTAWDQNAAMRTTMPGTAAVEELAGTWLLDLLGLPASASVGFTTGATAANFAALAAARHRVLADAGWDVERDGLSGAPHVRVLAGAERHGSVDLALRYLGLGSAELAPADDQGRVDVPALATALADTTGPTIVVLQAGNLHSGAFDDVGSAARAAHAHGAWVHVDGAFGLWAAASPRLAHLADGLADADSWATDAHKTLNTPYDCGLAIVSRPADAVAALGAQASYLVDTATGHDPWTLVPEMSRRARGVPVWATLATLGRSGVVALVDGLVDAAQDLAAALRDVPGVAVLNDVVYTQVCVTFGDDERTAAVAAALRDDGEAYASTSRWRGVEVLRFSVSNAWTDAAEVRRTVDAVRRALGTVDRTA